MEKEFIRSITTIIERDLTKLAQEISLYPDEKSIWMIKVNIKNPAGNLCLHVCGNLQHYFGAVLGKTGYIRNREYEFSANHISQTELLTEIERTKQAVKITLENFDASLLLTEYPEKVFDYAMTCMHFFNHLAAHLNYHLGQVNYHRRLIIG